MRCSACNKRSPVRPGAKVLLLATSGWVIVLVRAVVVEIQPREIRRWRRDRLWSCSIILSWAERRCRRDEHLCGQGRDAAWDGELERGG